MLLSWGHGIVFVIPYTKKTRESLRSHVEGLIRAFSIRGPERLRLVEKHIIHVHHALASGWLHEEEWAALKPHLPVIEWHRSWDRCERLRRAAIAVVVAERGTLGSILRDSNGQTVGWFVRSCGLVRGGYSLLAWHGGPVPTE